MFKFSTCLSVSKLPIDFGLPVIPVIFPGRDVTLHDIKGRDSPIQTLSIQGAEFNFCHIEPATVFGCVMDIETLCQTPGFSWLKNLIKRRKSMGIQIIHDQTYFNSVWVAFIHHGLNQL